ncbi:fibronectin-binding domain-containing protein, partial [bacterium]
PARRPRPIPYDAFSMAAVADEIRAYIGGKVQEMRQPSPDAVAIEIFAKGTKGWLLLNCHPIFARVHFTARRPETMNPPPTFIATLRARLEGARLARVTQIAADRILRLDFETEQGPLTLVAEIMGKHSNLILFDGARKILSAARWISPNRSVRPILSGRPYELPPVLRDAEDLTETLSPREVRARTGGRFVETLGTLPETWEPVIAAGFGAYPVPVHELGYVDYPRPTFSAALDSHYAELERSREFLERKARLSTTIGRLRESRALTLRGLLEVRASGLKADRWQRTAELILAYGYAITPGTRDLVAWDYDGKEVSIPIDPELSPAENAAPLFEKAKRARARAGELGEQIARFEDDLARLEGFARRVEDAHERAEVENLEDEARKRKWLVRPTVSARREERPYEGHRVREVLSPAGYTVLWGENATANDYLTLRVAKPSDLWFHARGITSAHVILRTGGKPDRVQRPDLEFAAAIAARNSAQKHSSLVPIDVTQRRYVRRQRGGAVGSVTYDHERTLHVAGGV